MVPGTLDHINNFVGVWLKECGVAFSLVSQGKGRRLLGFEIKRVVP